MIIEDRFKECSDFLALYLNPVDGDETYEMDGKQINLSQMLPFVFKHLNKVVIKHDEKSEEVFLWMIDAIHYFTGITDEKPETYYTTPEQINLKESGHKKPKVKVKTK